MSDTTGPLRIAAVIPALNEAPSIGRVVHGLRTQTTIALALVIVVDIGSSDGTADIARAAGATVVTGGAGLIGSHIVDLLLREGWSVRILDTLEPQTHAAGAPAWIAADAELCVGDIRDRAAVRAALDGVDVVFHQAAYGGYMPEMVKYVRGNSFGTAQLLETIRDERLPVQKVIVASSQAVYQEGAATCPAHGLVFPSPAAHRVDARDQE